MGFYASRDPNNTFVSPKSTASRYRGGGLGQMYDLDYLYVVDRDLTHATVGGAPIMCVFSVPRLITK